MIHTAEIGEMRTVACLDGVYQFVSDSQDVESVKEHIGKAAADYDSFFVIIGDGDYEEVWGMCGTVPYTSKLISRLV
jgi:hypothetical protein